MFYTLYLARLEAQLQLQNQFSREFILHVPLFAMAQKHQLQLRKYLLRELIMLPGYNYNYMKYALASDSRNDVVDHGSKRHKVWLINFFFLFFFFLHSSVQGFCDGNRSSLDVASDPFQGRGEGVA